MANTPFSENDIPASAGDMDLFVGIRNNGNGTYTNFNYTAPQIFAYVLAKTKRGITVLTENLGAGGTTLTDPFFDSPLQEIVANTATYIAGENFTQNGNTITGLDITFYVGQRIIAKK